jgi:hypothetical protein
MTRPTGRPNGRPRAADLIELAEKLNIPVARASKYGRQRLYRMLGRQETPAARTVEVPQPPKVGPKSIAMVDRMIELASKRRLA